MANDPTSDTQGTSSGLPSEEAVFIEFTGGVGGCGPTYFVGRSLADILRDTGDWKSCGKPCYTKPRQIPEREMLRINPRFLEEGVRAVIHRGCKSFMLGKPQP